MCIREAENADFGVESPAPGGLLNIKKCVQAQQGASHEMFFLDVLLVSPNRTRPPMRVGLNIFEHPHNQALSKVPPKVSSGKQQ